MRSRDPRQSPVRLLAGVGQSTCRRLQGAHAAEGCGGAKAPAQVGAFKDEKAFFPKLFTVFLLPLLLASADTAVVAVFAVASAVAAFVSAAAAANVTAATAVVFAAAKIIAATTAVAATLFVNSIAPTYSHHRPP